MKILKNTLLFIWEITKIVVLALLIVVPIRYFIFQPFFVRGQSMEPSFHNGDYLIVDEISYRFVEPQRGDVVVFNYPDNPSQRYIKRVIGLPEETVEIINGNVMIKTGDRQFILDEASYLPQFTQTQGDIITSLSKEEYFVLGDNRISSSDSRRWGTLPRENIVGRVLLRAWPFVALAKFEAPSY